MKTILTAFFYCIALNLSAQQLNIYGHFVDAEQKLKYECEINNEGGLIKISNLLLKGSSVFQMNNAYLTLSGNYENAPSVLRVYNLSGKELFTKMFSQTINFKLSENKKYCAFYDLKNINVVNLTTYEILASKGSTVFDVSNNGSVSYYDELQSELHFNNQSLKVTEPVYNILYYKNEPIIVTLTTIYKIENGILKNCFTTQAGRVFETKVIANQLCISTKTEGDKKFVFQSYCSNNLIDFVALQEKRLELMSTDNIIQNKNASAMLAGELIKDPLFYYSDTTYQPIGNSYAEIQEYSPGSPYLHPGVDLLGYDQQPVYAVKKSFVKAVITTNAAYHWRLAAANENTANATTGYLYAHLDELTIPYTVGDSINEGDVLGLLVDFPVTGFVHCHFARITDQGATWSGGWWTYDNPLSYMVNLYDTIAPTFETTIGADVFAFQDDAANYISPDSLYGSIKVVSKVYDQVNAAWHVDINKLRYNMSPLNSPQTILFDTLAYEYDFYTDVYPAGSYNVDVINIIYARDMTCYSTADYNVRDFYHIVTNSDGNDSINSNDAVQMFDTKAFLNGSYIFRVAASDPSGNTTVDSMIIQIKNSTAGVNELASSPFEIAPNPSSNGIFEIKLAIKKSVQLEVYSITGEKVLEQLASDNFKVDLSKHSKGIYVLKINADNQAYSFKLCKLE